MVSDKELVSPEVSRVTFRQLELNFRGLMADIDVQVLNTERKDNQAWVEASQLEERLCVQIDKSDSEHSEAEENFEVDEIQHGVNECNLNSTNLVKEKTAKSVFFSKNLEVSSSQANLGGDKTGLLINNKPTNFGNIDTVATSSSEVAHISETIKTTLNQDRIDRSAVDKCGPKVSSPEPSISEKSQKPLLEAQSKPVSQTNITCLQKAKNQTDQTFLKLPAASICSKTSVPVPGSNKFLIKSPQKSLTGGIPLQDRTNSLPQPIEHNSNPTCFGQQNSESTTDILLEKNQKTSSSKVTEKIASNSTPTESNSSPRHSSLKTINKSSATSNNSKASENIQEAPQPFSTPNPPVLYKKPTLSTETVNKENSFVIPDASIQIPKIKYCNPRGKPLTGPTPMIQITPCEGIEVGRSPDFLFQGGGGISSDSWADIKSQEFPAHIWSDLQITETELHVSPYKLMSTPVKILKQAPSASPLTPRRLAIPMPNSPNNQACLNPQTWIDNDNNSELQAWISSCNESDYKLTNFSTDHESNPFIPPIATSTPRNPQRLKRNVKLSLLNSGKHEELTSKLPDLDMPDLSNFLAKPIPNSQDLKNSPISSCLDNDWSQLTFGMNNSPEKVEDNPRPKRRSHVSGTFPQDLSLGFTSHLAVKENVVSNNIFDEKLDLQPNSGNNSDNESAKTLTPSFLRSQIDIDISDLKPSTPLRELQERRARELAFGQNNLKPTQSRSPEKPPDFDGSYVVGSVLDDGFSADDSVLHTNPIPQWARPGDQLDQKILALQSVDLDDLFGGFRPANLKQLFGNKSLSFMSNPPPPPVILPYTHLDSPFYPVNEYMIKPVQPTVTAPVFHRLTSNFSSKIATAPATGFSSPSKVLSFKVSKDSAKSSFNLPTKPPAIPSGSNIPRNRVIIRPQVRNLTRVPSKLATQMPQKQARRLEGPTNFSNTRRKI